MARLRRVRARAPRRIPWFAGTVLLAVAFLAVFGDLVAPHDAAEFNLTATYKPLFFMEGADDRFLLGTDGKGHDVLSRLIVGARVSLIVASLVVVVAGALGTVLGLLAGYFGGWTDSVIMRLVDIMLSIPAILLALVLVAAVGPGFAQIIGIIALTSWPSYARLVRGEVLVIRELDYVRLAKVAGASSTRILAKHVFPQVTNTLLVIATLQIGVVMIFEAALSFLGLGVQPPDTSWGQMISEGRNVMASAWWLAALPGISITLTVLSANLLGDWLRDTLDPKRRQV